MKKLLLLFAIVLFIHNARAQWQTGGPTNQLITCLASSGPNVFANNSDNGGIYLSSNNGGSWSMIDSVKLSGIYVLSLATNGPIIYAGTTTNILLSTNNGATWIPGDTGLPANSRVDALVISGSDIFAGTAVNGIFLSSDNGHHWKEVNTGLSDTDITALAVSGSNIFAGTYGGGMFVSSNNGNQWTPVNTGITDMDILSLAVGGVNIFAGTLTGSIFLSNNNGSSWTSVFSVESEIKAIAISGQDIYAGTYDLGVFLSTNNGGSWNATNSGLLNMYINALVINNSIVFAGTEGSGVWQQPVANTTGIQETPAAIPNNFTLYPNPANGNFNLETNITRQQQSLQVFDITGKLMLTQTITNSKTTVDASSLADGIYSVRLLSNDIVANEKLVIVR